MPLTAVLDGRPIFVFDHDAPALANIASLVKRRCLSLRCKDCAYAMTIVMSGRRRWHFRHLPGAPADCHFVIARESDAHRDLKRRIYDMCRAREWEAEAEWRVPGTSRRADVWARDHLGRQFTFEVQLSAIRDDTCYDRSSDHLRAGFTPVWLVEGDLRSWAFPEGTKRVRLQRLGDWVLTGMGGPISAEDVQGRVAEDLLLHARTARALAFTKLLSLLDAPAPVPSPTSFRRVDGHRSPLVDRRPLALPAPARAASEPSYGRPKRLTADQLPMPLNSVAAPRRMFVKQTSTSKRYLRNPDLPDHVVVIDRLRSLATVLAHASMPDRDRFERMRELPLPQWTADHLATALKEIWVHRLWLWERDWEPCCGGCGLPLDPVLIRRGYHLGCFAPKIRCR